MKHLNIFILLILILSCSASQKDTKEKFEVFRGTNIAHWLSQNHRRGTEREQFFTRTDVEAIAEMGFDHIRLPIDEEQMWDENGNRHNDAFKLMENCIEWCIDNNLRVIVDLHILRSHYFNADEKPLWTDSAEQDKFCDLWRDLSSALNKYPNSKVAYELMNEAVADDPEDWNSLVTKAVEAIRSLEAGRTIVIGSNSWQSTDTFDELRIPENDPNILLSFHFYDPFLLTHWKASWSQLRDYDGPVHYPGIIITEEELNALPPEKQKIVKNWAGKEYNKEWILDKWQKPIQKANELGLPLYCGEFGIITGPPETDRLLWYKDMIELFEETGIGYANWNYKSDQFGLINNDGSRNEELISIVSAN